MTRLVLKNKLELISSDEGDYLCIGYYISKYSCEIIIKRFDNENGWNNNLKIFIDQNEIIEISNSSNSNTKYFINTNTELFHVNSDYKQKIPKVIIQTDENQNYKDINHYIAISTTIDLNPEYEYKFFNNIERREFIKKHFNHDVLEAYDILIPGAFKADLFRYCYLYINGGCYFDYKIIAREPLRNIIKENDELLICVDYDKQNTIKRNINVGGYLNAIIMCTSNNQNMLRLINQCVDNIINKQDIFYHLINTRGYMDILLLTGPTLMYNVFKDHVIDTNLRFKHIILNNDETYYKNFQIVDIDTQKLLFTKTFKTNLNGDNNHYSNLWIKKELFYINKTEFLNLIAYVYPHHFNNTFKFTFDKQYIYTERTDSRDQWGLNLNVKIIDNITSQQDYINIGRNSRTLLNKVKPILYPNVYLSTSVKDTDINVNVNTTLLCITSLDQLINIDYIRSNIPDSLILLCFSDENNTNDIERFSKLVDYVILYTESICNYYCNEKNLKEAYISLHILNLFRNAKFKFFKFFYNECNLNLVDYKNINKYINHCKRFLKPSIKDTKEFINFCENYYIVDIITLYNSQLSKYQYVLENLNNIVTESGEKLEGNIFYEHDTYGTYNQVLDFENKRYNLFYYARQAYNIVEIGFNGGHSTLLYLIANQSSKIQLFDLGEHSYSKKCFEYLNKEFPNRLSIIWGDSTKTVEEFKTNIKYDFIHIDGGHTKFIAESDFYNCKQLADEDSLILIDDTQCEPLLSIFDDIVKCKIAEKIDLEYDTDNHMLIKYII